MVDPGVERTKVSTAEQPRVTPRPAVTVVTLVITAWKSQLPPPPDDEPRVCAQHM
jgi:hypothetical protein